MGQTQTDGAQAADAVLMIRPRHFASNPATAATNAFQQFDAAPAPALAQARAVAEFDGAVAALRAAGVRVIVADDTPAPVTPDAVFPNNWFSTHGDGRVVLYPMLAPNRRDERRADLVPTLLPDAGYAVREVLDLTGWEDEGAFLEGTGSLVLDRIGRVAFAARSPRTDARVVQAFARAMGYAAVVFDAVDAQGRAVYHTNVVMCVGTGFAVICARAIADEATRRHVLALLRESGREVIDIDPAQLAAFAGNVLELRAATGAPYLAMSRTACGAFTAAQRDRLCQHATPVVADLPVIEQCAGGSLRCMLAEIHLPPLAGAAIG